MDGKQFDDLARVAGDVMPRRSALGRVLVSAAAVMMARPGLASAKRGGKKKKRCRKLTQGCGGKQKCCNGLTCANGACACAAGTVASGNACVPQQPGPTCASDAQCGSGQVCQVGTCVPAPSECVKDADCNLPGAKCVNGTCVVKVVIECAQNNDCGPNEVCETRPNGRVCICPDTEAGRCIRRCEKQSNCPGACSCRNHFPEASPFIEDGICVKEPFLLCDAKTCNGDSDCKSNEICIGTGCGSNGTVFKCSPICVD
ncbi:MAG: hypothetical protein U0075_16550 [Thermomicrobiales bacterium]